MVASARPDAAAAPASSSPSVLPLRNAPRRLTGKQISVSSVTVTLSVPGGQTLIDFPLGTVLTTSQIPVTLTLGEGTYDLKFEPPLLIQVDPSKLQSQAASLLLKLAADVVEATFGLKEIRYTSASRSATCDIVAVGHYDVAAEIGPRLLLLQRRTIRAQGKADPRQHYPRKPPPRPPAVDSEMGHRTNPLPREKAARMLACGLRPVTTLIERG
jgi:hypothetical protein